jgi:hypothetical protein
MPYFFVLNIFKTGMLSPVTTDASLWPKMLNSYYRIAIGTGG